MNISAILNEYIDEDYKKFHKRICKTNYEILGVKIPTLRKITKELLKDYSYEDILNNLNDIYYEHVMLMGLAIANSNIDYENKLFLIKNYLNKIDNWGICDIFCSELKFVKNEQKEFLKFILPYLDSNQEFDQRFAIVILIDYYINEQYIDLILHKMLEIKSDKYYVKMAISWCLSICLIRYFDKTIIFLKSNKNKFDKWIFNKALQKARESFRISKENKEILHNMKIK